MLFHEADGGEPTVKAIALQATRAARGQFRRVALISAAGMENTRPFLDKGEQVEDEGQTDNKGQVDGKDRANDEAQLEDEIGRDYYEECHEGKSLPQYTFTIV
jgi:hypothetical protein